MNINLSLLNLVFYFFGIISFLILLVLSFKLYFRLKAKTLQGHSGKDEKRIQNFKNRNKYAEVDIFRYTPEFFKLGLIISISILFLSFNYTSYLPTIDYQPDILLEENVDIIIPPTHHKIEKPEVIVAPVVELVPDDEILDESPELLSMDPEIDLSDFEVSVSEPDIQAVFTPPEIKDDFEEIINFAQEMPRFPGCEDLNISIGEKKECAEKAMMAYIYDRLKYPAVARENGIEGIVTVQFVVMKSGEISNIVIIRDIGGGCGEAVTHLVSTMNNMSEKWTPGRQRGHKVNVRFTLPVKFVLQ